MFERPLKEAHGDGSASDRRVDCYKRGHFILEAKKLKVGSHTKGYDDALLRAHAQAQNYARALPAALGLDAIAAHFKGKGRWRERLPMILETLVAIGRARSEDQSWRAA